MRQAIVVILGGVLCLAGALVAGCGGGGGGDGGGSPSEPQVDQEYAPPAGAPWENGISGDQDVAQTFTAGLTGRLVRVEIEIRRYMPDGDLTVDIRNTDGGGLPVENDGASLVSVNVPAASVSDSPAMVVVDLGAAAPTVTAGQSYALVLRTVTGGYAWGYGDGNPYAAGGGFLRTYPAPGTWQADADNDHAFRTWVAP